MMHCYGVKPKEAGKLVKMNMTVNESDVKRMKEYFPEFNASFFFRQCLSEVLLTLEEKENVKA